MKYWIFALVAHFLILAVGIGLMGEGFTELSILHAPIVNLLIWTGLTCLAGLAASATTGSLHRRLARVLLVSAIAWFPLSLMIFGNARFSGTSDVLWQLWLYGTAGLVVASLASLLISVAARLLARYQLPNRG